MSEKKIEAVSEPVRSPCSVRQELFRVINVNVAGTAHFVETDCLTSVSEYAPCNFRCDRSCMRFFLCLLFLVLVTSRTVVPRRSGEETWINVNVTLTQTGTLEVGALIVSWQIPIVAARNAVRHACEQPIRWVTVLRGGKRCSLPASKIIFFSFLRGKDALIVGKRRHHSGSSRPLHL